jgi:hypothetical protein
MGDFLEIEQAKRFLQPRRAAALYHRTELEASCGGAYGALTITAAAQSQLLLSAPVGSGR